MKLTTLTLAFAFALLLQGCATVVVCRQDQIQLLNAENARLLASKEQIIGFDQGKPIPGIVFSSLSRADLIAAYKADYNRAVTHLEAQAKQCRI